jgi:hypothetical protein
MNMWTGIAMLAIALVLIWLGLLNGDGVHRRFLRFSAAQIIYPPVILAFIALGSAAVIGSI